MQTSPAPSDEALAKAHARLLQDASLQFDRLSIKPPETPGWVKWLGEALKDLEPVLKWAFWIADQGLYAEAAHLLLLRSVQDIEKRQPRAVRISLTTREIAVLEVLPESARPAFSAIGRVVERSLFGGAPVGSSDFADCRQAYEDFALPAGWSA